jgi:hypothetical protein
VIHSYPNNLVEIILEKWDAGQSGICSYGSSIDVKCDQVSTPEVLDRLISTCYQSSIMLEEERPLRFRLILRDPEKFAAEDGPPDGLHRLIFRRSSGNPRAF